MAEIELYIITGNLMGGTGEVQRSNPDNSIYGADAFFREWNPDARYQWGPRSAAGGYNQESWVWEHNVDRRDIVGLPQAANPVVTFSGAALGVALNSVKEVEIRGVTLGDSSLINGTHEGIVVGDNAIQLQLDTTGLTYSLTGASVWLGRARPYQPDDTYGFGVANSHTDPSFGGVYPSLSWGPDLSFVERIQSEKASLSDPVPWLLKWLAPYAMWARPAIRDVDAAGGATTTLTFATNVFLGRERRRMRVTLDGFAGITPSIDGERDIWPIADDQAVVLGVATTSGSATGGLVGLEPTLGPRSTEVRADFFGRINELAAYAAGQGDTVRLAGLIVCNGYPDVSAWNEVSRREVPVTAVSDTGSPTTITLASSIAQVDEWQSRNLLNVELRNLVGNPALNARFEAFVDAQVTNQLRIHVDNTAAIDVSNATALVGDPVDWFDADIVEARSWMLSTTLAAIGSGQAADDVPVIHLRPDPDTVGEWWTGGAVIWSDFAPTAIVRTAVRRAARRSRSLMVDLDDLGKISGSAVNYSPGEQLRMGDRMFNAIVRTRASIGASTAGMPVYYFIGDSLCVGTMSWVTFRSAGNPDYSGSHSAPRGTLIWNHATGQGEESRSSTQTGSGPGNANTHPGWNAYALDQVGSEQSLILDLKKRHPDTDILLVKLGVGISTLQAHRSALTLSEGAVSATQLLVKASPLASYASTFQIEMPDLTSNGISNAPAGIYDAEVFYDPSTTQPTWIVVTYPGGNLSGTWIAGTTAAALAQHPSWDPADSMIWPDWQQIVADANAWVRAQGRWPDARGAFVRLGLNDAFQGISATFSTALAAFVPDLRALIQTRSEPSPAVPVIWSNLRSHSYQGIDPTEITTVQAALATYALTDSQFTVTDMDVGAEDPECGEPLVPINDDGVHWTYTGFVNAGCLDDKGLDAVDNSCASAAGATTSSGLLVTSGLDAFAQMASAYRRDNP